MRKHVAVVLAGSLGVVGMVGCDDPGADNTTPGEQVERAIDRTGEAIARGAEKTGQALDKAADKTAGAVGRGVDQAVDLGHRAGDEASEWLEANVSDTARIRDTLASAAEAALTRGRMNDLVSRLAGPDRARVGQFLEDSDAAEISELSQYIDRFRSRWQGKYNQAFDIDDENAILQNVRITTTTEGDERRAKVVLPSLRGMPALNLSLINEGSSLDAWRIDAPDSLTADSLRAALTAEIQKLEEFSSAWPEDVNEASRLVVHRVLSPLAESGVAATASR